MECSTSLVESEGVNLSIVYFCNINKDAIHVKRGYKTKYIFTTQYMNVYHTKKHLFQVLKAIAKHYLDIATAEYEIW